MFQSLFGLKSASEKVDDPMVFAIFGLLESLALERALCDSEEEERRRFEPAIAYVKTIANFVAREARHGVEIEDSSSEVVRR